MNGIRVWLDMSALFSGARQQSCVFVNHDKQQTVRDVEDHIRRLFVIDGPFYLLNDGYYLPPSESSFLLRDNDTLSIIRESELEILNEKIQRKSPPDSIQTDMEASRSLEKNKVPNAPASAQNTELVQLKSKNCPFEDIRTDPLNAGRAAVQESAQSLKERSPATQLPLKDQLSHQHLVGKLSASLETSTKELSPSMPASNGNVSKTLGDNDVDTNSETDSGMKRKRIRRRKKKPSQDMESEPKPKEPRQSPYILNKYIQGVSHILNTSIAVSHNKKHIFFQDEHDKSDVNLKLSDSLAKVNENSIPTATPTSNCIGGDLSKLMSLGNQKSPAVFERKRIDQAPGCPPETVKPVLADRTAAPPVSIAPKLVTLDSMPVKETIIKFKVLKMVNYSPVLSEQITARVISPDFTSNQLFVQILEGLSEFQSEKGKFSLDEDDMEDSVAATSEYIYLNFSDLIEPKSVQYH
ncbi:Coilin [Frankliniella fusca]|uniref:Coilin n=1 Tax=Frankliniella fusca TaxID=407009 RepID=A0AAE1HJD0_9NEOP|nr:Coilin [Frankliniella fusca]